MSRYSPTVTRSAGPRFDPETIARAIDQFQREREHAADRATEADDRRLRLEDRERGIKNEREDRKYTRGVRERENARADAEDLEAGIRTGPMPSPFATRIEQLQSDIANPVRLVAGRVTGSLAPRLPGSLDPERQSFDDAAAESANYVPLSGGRYLDRTATPEAEEERAAEARAARAGKVGAGLGADDALQEYFRFNPEALDEFMEHQWGMKENEARDAAALERAKTPRPRAGGAGGDDGGLTENQALTQARSIVYGYNSAGQRSYQGVEGLVQDVARALRTGGDVRAVMQRWEESQEQPAPPPAEQEEPGFWSRFGNFVSGMFDGDDDERPAPSRVGGGGAARSHSMPEADVQQLRGLAGALTDEEIAEELRADGYDDDEIREILSEIRG